VVSVKASAVALVVGVVFVVGAHPADAASGSKVFTTSGQYSFTAFDDDDSQDYEALTIVTGGGDFAYGTVDVHIPYRARCDRYRRYASDAVRLVDSRPCTGPRRRPCRPDTPRVP
jgi:hypothetical protein